MTAKLLGNLNKGLLFIVSAPPGTGKTTLVNMLATEFPCVVASISFTTRQPRSGEIDGVHYFFVSEENFKERITKGEFLEYIKLYGDYYGTSKVWMEEQLALGKHVILVIDTQGAQTVRSLESVITIFIKPPSFSELERRLRARHTNSEENIEKRLLWAKEELQAESRYDYSIVNDDLSIAYQTLRSILIAEEHRVR